MKAYQRCVLNGVMGCGIVAYLMLIHFSELTWDLGRWAYPEGWPLTPPELIGVCCGLLAFVIMRRSQRINGFMNEAASELAKVTYPQRKETALATVVVVIFVGFCSLVLSLYDVVWGWSVKLMY